MPFAALGAWTPCGHGRRPPSNRTGPERRERGREAGEVFPCEVSRVSVKVSLRPESHPNHPLLPPMEEGTNVGKRRSQGSQAGGRAGRRRNGRQTQAAPPPRWARKGSSLGTGIDRRQFRRSRREPRGRRRDRKGED